MNQITLAFGSDSTVLVGYAHRANDRLGSFDLLIENTGDSTLTFQTKEYVPASNTYTNLGGLQFATGWLTSNGTNVANNATVTLGAKTYTFKTSLTPTEGEVLIGGSAAASLLNLIRAVNHTGTPDTDYSCAAAHTTISAASAVATLAVKFTALTAGSAGNSLATTETSGTLSFGAATLTGGGDAPTVAARGTRTLHYNVNSSKIGFFGSGGTTANVSVVMRNPADLRGAQIDLVATGHRGWGFDRSFNQGELTKQWGAPPDSLGTSAPSGGEGNG